MNIKLCLTIGFVALTGSAAHVANAEVYSETTTVEQSAPSPAVETREIRTIEPAVIKEEPTTVIKEQPIIVPPVNDKMVVVKKHSHHLLNLGLIKIF